ncbi:MAG: FlgD immunoglobulin-like domain containing protein [bacterium]
MARGRGHTFVAIGDLEEAVYAYDESAGEWVENEDLQEMPVVIDVAGAMAYERIHNYRLFVAPDDAADSLLNVYHFHHPWGLLELWRNPDVSAPLRLPDSVGQGVALAFRPVEDPASTLSGHLYLLVGARTRRFWRRPFQQLGWAPDALWPPDGGEVSMQGLYLDWQPLVGARGYHLQVAVESGFLSPLLDVRTTAAEYYPPGNRLPEGRALYWRTRVTRVSGDGIWSPVRSFRLSGERRSSAAHRYPPDGTLTAGDWSVFDWSAENDARAYQLQVSDSRTRQPVLDTLLETSEFIWTGPLLRGEYAWRTRWQDGVGNWRDWSGPSGLLSVHGWESLPSVPCQETVAEGAAMCYTKDLNGAESLYVLVGNNSREFWRFNVNAGTWTPRANTPWQQQGGVSITPNGWWSGYPEALFALPGENDDSLWRYSIADSWRSSRKLPRVRPQNGVPYGSCINWDEGSALHFVLAGDYDPEEETNFYAWSPGDDGDGPMSAGQTGRAQEPVSVDRGTGLLALSYALERTGPVRVVVHDAAGRRVRVLAAGPMPAGVYRVNWDYTADRGGKVRSGVYFIRLDLAGRPASVKVPVW